MQHLRTVSHRLFCLRKILFWPSKNLPVVLIAGTSGPEQGQQRRCLYLLVPVHQRMARTKKKNTTPAMEEQYMRWQEACRQPVRLPPPKSEAEIQAEKQESRKRVRSQFPKDSPGWEVEGHPNIGYRFGLIGTNAGV